MVGALFGTKGGTTRGMGDPVQLLISIDVEPDDQLVDRDNPGPWRGFEDLLRQIGPIRDRFHECTGRPVYFGWYWRLDPQIEETYGTAAWPLRSYAPAIDELSRAEDAFGVHTHAWRWSPARRSWFADHADRDWVTQCLQLSFETFERFFQAPCTAHRFGSSWINDATLDVIERLGADYDLTVEAGHPPGPVYGWRDQRASLISSYASYITDHRSNPMGQPPANRCRTMTVTPYRKLPEVSDDGRSPAI